ncbi:MAG: hypothetical protein ACJ8MH_02230 [Povalibacter sp.]
MNTSNPNDPLERFVDAALRDLPPRRAPSTLEMRVFAELQRRAELKWWQRSYAEWPALARILFVIACIAVGSALVRGFSWFFGGVESSAAWSGVASEITPAAASVKATASALSFIAHSIPSLWVYGAVAVIAVLYATLFGIGAAAYRTLYASR